MKLIVISFAAACLFGVWLGTGPAGHVVPVNPGPTARAREDRTVARKWSREDFQSRARDIVATALVDGGDHSSGLLESWTDAEIRAALDDALENPDYVLENGGRGHVMDALFSEWMKRDLEAAIIWFDSVRIEAARNRMILNLSYRWPAEHARRGLDFVRSHKELFTRGSPWSILLKNIEAGAKDGPETLGRLLGRIADEELGLDFGNPVKFEILTTMDAVLTPASFAMRQPVSAEDAEMLREKLRDWQAGESQIEEILKKIKP